MPKLLKRLLIGVAVLGVIAYFGFGYMKSQTKKASPEETVTFVTGGLTTTVNYSRPSKKGRPIFGTLVPYGEVWRTGANEPTTVAFDKAVTFGGTAVPAGKYTLWTVPGPQEWSVILNRAMYGWGVSFGGTASRDAAADVATAKVPVEQLRGTVEQLSIRVEGDVPALVLEWENTRVSVPLQ